MFHIALYEPKIAPNTGNIIRLAANNGCTLHLIEPFGFDLAEKNLRRAGLDYHDLSNVIRHPDHQSFVATVAGKRIFACTTKGQRAHSDQTFLAGDVLLFGSETHGLPDTVMQTINESRRLRIPMMPNSRSLNLANAVAIVSYEAWRQLDFQGAKLIGGLG